MNEKEEKLNAHTEEAEGIVSGSDAADQLETPSRRELIERYGKYAVVAAPLMLFATKARAIRSVP
jgi:hypothetical protein